MQYYPWSNNMCGGSDYGVLTLLLWLVVLFDLVLLGIWLWQNIRFRK